MDKIDNLLKRYLMERFSLTGKSVHGSTTIEDKIDNIAEHAATVSIDWLKVKRNRFWDLSRQEQLKLINKNLNDFVKKYKEDIQSIIEDNDYQKFIKNNKTDIIKKIRRFMISIYGE